MKKFILVVSAFIGINACAASAQTTTSIADSTATKVSAKKAIQPALSATPSTASFQKASPPQVNFLTESRRRQAAAQSFNFRSDSINQQIRLEIFKIQIQVGAFSTNPLMGFGYAPNDQ